MGVVLGSGYSQVPPISESALISLATTAMKENEVQHRVRESPIVKA